MEETSADGLPICGRTSRLRWLRLELEKQAGHPGASRIQPIEMIGWYLRCGFSMGLSREELTCALRDETEWLKLAETASDQDIAQGKSPPEYSIGQHVEVVVNARNITYRQGIVSDMMWHHHEGIWHYFIEENGKRIGKRYETRDIRPVATSA
ncbi:MAG: hypothetical protein E6Q50_11610 [Lysobacter sp.]|nr:MAG: hypothetical protein E6Q50_11610 [Lysobacter sp.]